MTLFNIIIPADGSVVTITGLELVEGEVLVLYGPNGAGKTTILRNLAGIKSEARIDCVYQPQKAHMFHGLAGWNLGLGLSDEEASWAGQLADRLGVGELMTRSATTLSGGEAQRLSLARTLARRARWVLLDEPLMSVDAIDKERVLRVLSEFLKERGAVIVTHDLEVAVALGDRIAVVAGGELLQQGPIGEVLANPADADVARIIGLANVVSGTAVRVDASHCSLVSQGFTIVGSGVSTGPARAVFGAESVVVSRPGGPTTSERNRWEGEVAEVRNRGTTVEVVVDVGPRIVALLTAGGAAEIGAEVGSRVAVSVKASAVTVLPA